MKSNRAKVQYVNWPGQMKVLYLQTENSQKSEEIPSSLHVPRSSCASKGDILLFKGDEVYVDCNNGEAQLIPAYEKKKNFSFAGEKLYINFKEIETQTEYQQYQSLSNYHYRNQNIFGRHAPIIAKVDVPFLPEVIGYIELATSFYYFSPRSNFFDTEVSLNGVSWDQWGKEVVQNYIGLFVRIARSVVHPELRGLGLGQLLIKVAEEFARDHWQSNNFIPYFLEISAQMLEFNPFAEKAGMHFIVRTQGNKNRVLDDLEYWFRNKDEIANGNLIADKSGIVETKISNFQSLYSKLEAEEEEINFAKMKEKVSAAIQEPEKQKNQLARKVLSFPKPTYIKGLYEFAEDFIESRKKELGNNSEEGSFSKVFSAEKELIEKEVRFDNLTVHYTLDSSDSKSTFKIRDSFELGGNKRKEIIVEDLSFTIRPGEICFCTGISGSGKSTLVDILSHQDHPSRVIHGELKMPRNSEIARMKPIDSDKPLVEYFGDGEVQRGLRIMNIVGLSGVNLYLKNFSSLSIGQKYRAMLADLIKQGTQFWVIDEFSENLDPINSKVIANKLQSYVRTNNITAFIASADPNYVLENLEPDSLLVLFGEGFYKFEREPEFLDRFRQFF